MTDGFSTSDAVLTSAMSGGFGGNRGGQWGNNGIGSPFADMGSNAVRLNRNEGTVRDAQKCTQDVLGLGLDRISAQNFEGRFNAAATAITDGQFRAELRNGDRLRDLEREMNANARKADTCCCDLKLQSCQDKAEILAAIAASESRGVERDRNTLQAELISLKTQVACGCCNG